MTFLVLFLCIYYNFIIYRFCTISMQTECMWKCFGDEFLFITLVMNITSPGRLCVELFFKRDLYFLHEL